jgi:pimeloyl-ACP methyl ester carboxylesterase
VGDVVAVIRHFGREKAVVVGHDWGGMVAWSVAMAHPEMIERLVAKVLTAVADWRMDQEEAGE